jgi:hypothetical protein
MKRDRSFFSMLIAGMLASFPVQAEPSSPDSLLPGNTSVYVRISAGADVAAAWRQSAAHRAIVDSGLLQFLSPFLTTESLASLMTSTGMPDDPSLSLVPELLTLAQEIAQQGLLVGADIRVLAGEVTAVIPNAAGSDLAGRIDAFARKLAEANGLEVTEQTQDGRKFTVVKPEGFWLGWWKEGSHLVIAGNQLGPNPILRRLKGQSDDLTKSARYESFRSKADYPVLMEAWVDAEALMKLLPQGIPEVPPMIEMLGAKSLAGLRFTTGFQGEAMRTDWSLLLKEPRLGPFALLGNPPLDIAQLPKLPHDVDFVFASSLDAVKLYDGILSMVEQSAKIMQSADLEAVPTMISAYEEQIGFQFRDEVLAALGDRVVVYTCPTDGPFFTGVTLAIAVKDATLLEGFLDRMVDLVGIMDSRVLMDKRKDGDNTYWIGGYADSGMPFAPTVALSKDWLVATLVAPSAIQRFFETQSTTSKHWSAGDLKDQLPQAGGPITGLMYSDPRPNIRLASSFLPLVTGFLRNAYPQAKVDPIHAPRADVIADSAFPGVAVTWSDAQGVHCSSRYSLPMTNPELGLFLTGFFGSAIVAGIGESSLEGVIPDAIAPDAMPFEENPDLDNEAPGDDEQGPDTTQGKGAEFEQSREFGLTSVGAGD